MVGHLYVKVNSDQQKEAGFEGTLADFAAVRLSEEMESSFPGGRIISVESSFWESEIRPVQCNSSTWYDRQNMQLSVWVEASG